MNLGPSLAEVIIYIQVYIFLLLFLCPTDTGLSPLRWLLIRAIHSDGVWDSEHSESMHYTRVS